MKLDDALVALEVAKPMQKFLSAMVSRDFSGITFAIEEITPPLAQKWLAECNLGNRPLNKKHVRDLANAMLDGEWMLNGEALVFGRDGRILNAQHRLHACVLANRSFHALVVRGVDPAAFATFDQGRPRKAADVLAINQVGQPNLFSRSLRALMAYQMVLDGRTVNANQLSFRNWQVIEYVKANPEVEDAFKAVEPLFKHKHSGFRPYVAVAFYCLAAEQGHSAKCILDFLSKVALGDEDLQSPAQVLCDHFDDDANKINKAEYHMVAYIRAFNAWVCKKPLAKVDGSVEITRLGHQRWTSDHPRVIPLSQVKVEQLLLTR
ncbi:MAG: hypothetical protein EBQ80_00555 [Proteobacteria bacterium]|nr:hypothetical protein [Pseudomonadota bacterium]